MPSNTVKIKKIITEEFHAILSETCNQVFKRINSIDDLNKMINKLKPMAVCEGGLFCLLI